MMTKLPFLMSVEPKKKKKKPHKLISAVSEAKFILRQPAGSGLCGVASQRPLGH